MIEASGDRKIQRGERIERFKQKYNSCPMQQLMRNIAGLEEKSHSEKTRAGYRLARGGRMKKMKMEPREGYQSAETAHLLTCMNEAAGAGVEPTSAAMDTE